MSTTDRTATCATPERRLLALALLLALASCEGDTGPAGPVGPPGTGGGGGGDEETPTVYAGGESVPELRVAITELLGASGPNGEFQVGDVPSVRFSLLKEDGTAWGLEELVAGEALLSGPTFNYQRVLPLEDDVLARAQSEGEGRYVLAFSAPIPALYAPPYNDTTSFGFNAGELSGRALLDGTYTVGLSFTWDFTVDGVADRRVGEATFDFVLGAGAGALTRRAVTTVEHCDRCHTELQAHDGRYRDWTLCLLCHTAGAEDANDPAIAGGTPAVTIDSRVLFHRLHNGRSLPSVNGVASRGNGNRNYDAAPRPLQYARPGGTVRDFSSVGFPAMPNRVAPMPKDIGFSALTAAQQAQEDVIRSGLTQCAVCHGDPDGDGPLTTPPQGNLHFAQQSRKACGSCHDDVNFSNSYRSNNQTMPPQNNDNTCNGCHDTRFPGQLSPIDAHVHPLLQPETNPGVKVELLALGEAAPSDGDGTLDPGEGVALSFTLEDDAGAAIVPSQLSELRAVLAGPNTNFQVLLDETIPGTLVGGAQPFEFVMPERLELEFLGDSTAGLDTFQSARFPQRESAATPTLVAVRAVTAGGASALLAPAGRRQTFLDVGSAAGFARGDFVVVDDGVPGAEEYLRLARVEATRLWLGDPEALERGAGLRGAHAPGATVKEVELAPAVEGLHYALDPGTGTLTELAELGPGRAVLVSYTADYRLPADYPAPANDSPDLDDGDGEWTGKALVSGTYVASLSAGRDVTFFAGNTPSVYRATSPAATRAVLVGDATEPAPYTRIADGAACNACHQELQYHDSFRGFDTCILCHGASGTEDRSRSAAASAPETPGVSVQFRTLVHKIHRGREGGDPDYRVVGAGPSPFPDDFRVHAYTDFSPLPAFPGRTLQCARCHGAGNTAALLPSTREHPVVQLHPLQVWRPVCSGCHDSEAVIAHLDSNTAPNGAEACVICHDRGEFEDALLAHGIR